MYPYHVTWDTNSSLFEKKKSRSRSRRCKTDLFLDLLNTVDYNAFIIMWRIQRTMQLSRVFLVTPFRGGNRRRLAVLRALQAHDHKNQP